MNFVMDLTVREFLELHAKSRMVENEEEAISRLLDFLEYCKVGKLTLGETIKMRESCERFGMKTKEPSCYFTTGFLNGFFSAIKKSNSSSISMFSQRLMIFLPIFLPVLLFKQVIID
jgi:predicted hydrocarbon binding protein